MRRFYNPRELYYKEPFGAVEEQTEIRLRFCAPRELAVKEALLIIDRDHCDETSVRAAWSGLENGMDVYTCHYAPQQPGIYFYQFCLITWQDEWIFVLPDGAYGRLSGSKDGEYQLSVYESGFTTPDWMKGGLMYQIFPDRFSRSRAYDMARQTERDERMRLGMQKDYVLREDWGGLPVYKPNEDGKVLNNDFFGGNLQGITEKLPYLEELGVTILYLNPIFEAFSSHRYDTADYKRIDPMLGTEADFEALCAAARARGMRVILDGVFNHTGSDSIYFNREGRYPGKGAYQSKESPYFDWYGFFDFPHGYSSWWGIDTLPQVDEQNAAYRDYIITGEDSVLRHWIRKGASGYRLDVADELPPVFLDELRAAVKEENSDAVIIGEVWEDASCKIAYERRTQYFWGRELDSVMNYPLKDALIDFLCGKVTGADFSSRLETLRENYPKQVFYGTMNLLGTHDTARILTVLSLGDRIWGLSRDEKAVLQEQISEEEQKTGRQRLFLALLVWAFFPGAPCLYYGDELGMQGAEDPFNRQCFDESTADQEIAAYYRRLLQFRKSLGSFGQWLYEPVVAGESFYGFRRMSGAASEGAQTDQDRDSGGACGLYVIINPGDSRLVLPVTAPPFDWEWGELVYCGEPIRADKDFLEIPPASGVVIEVKKEKRKELYADI